MTIEENIALGPLTTFGIGGRARFFVRAKTEEDVRAALTFARERGVLWAVIGGGSNLLVADEGFDGLVIKMELSGIAFQEGAVTAGAGAVWDELVAECVTRGLWGIENLSGIPGTVGGAVVQNIGAYGAALSEVLREVRVLDAREGSAHTFTRENCGFDYRDSVFKHRPDLIVLDASFALSTTPAPNLSYRDLATHFAGKTPTLAEIREAVLEIRRGKFPDLAVEGTAGSFFKNPIVDRALAQELKCRYPEMPLFDMPETTGIKVPVAWLLDKELRLRGYAHGGARLFEKQPLVIAAARGTSAADVRALSRDVAARVRAASNIELEPEVRFLPAK